MMEGKELPVNQEASVKHYDVIVPLGFTSRVARVANKIVTTEISSGGRSETVDPKVEEDVTGRFQTALNIGTFEKRSVVFSMSEAELGDITARMNKLAEEEHDPLKAGEIRDVARRLTEQFEEAKNPPAQEAKEPSRSGIGSIRSWFAKRTEHGKFD